MDSACECRKTGHHRALPGWVPEPVRVYLAHTAGGESLRALARRSGQHPSTVLRQVRRTENLRDDPLSDTGLDRLGQRWAHRSPASSAQQDLLPMSLSDRAEAALARDSLRALRALMEPKTLMVIADGVEDAVVVHDAGTDRPVRRCVVSREVAEALALREFITGKQTGRLARYTITGAGRVEVRRMLAEAESRRATQRGTGEEPALDGDDGAGAGATAPRLAPKPRRSAGTDAPLHILARRNRPDGEAWLPPELVAAALRFRENWEIAQIGGSLPGDWDVFVSGRFGPGLSGQGRGLGAHPSGRATRRLEAEEALAGAIRALGPDLAEAVLLGVCQEHGMEDIEKRLAYPARSGKIVLRIALRMLARHFQQTASDRDRMIY